MLWLTALSTIALVCAACGVRADDPEKITLQLTDILWDVDYQTFTADKTTEFAKQYYESGYLNDYLEDPDYNAGVLSVQEDQLISRVLAKEVAEVAEETVGGELYDVVTVRATIVIDHYVLENPEDSYFQQGEEYNLDIKGYFQVFDGQPKLVHYEYLPADGVFLPERAQNVTLTEEQRSEIKEAVNAYYSLRYDISSQTFDAQEAYEFYQGVYTPEFLEKEGVTLQSQQEWAQKLNEFAMNLTLKEVSVDLPKNKSAVYTEEGTEFYYVVHAQVTYTIDAKEEYFLQAEMEKGEEIRFEELLAFVQAEDGGWRITYAQFT